MKRVGVLNEDNPVRSPNTLIEEYLKENNIINLLPTAVYACDATGSIVQYNQKAVELWGRTPKQHDQHERFGGALKLYYPDGSYMPDDEMPVAACLSDGLPRTDQEMIMDRPDHSQITVSMSVVPVKGDQGKVIGAISCFYDSTGQKKTQKELDRKTKELQDYVDNGPIGLHWVDADGIIQWANKAELNMLGYTAEEYIGHPISEFHADKDKINDILKRLCGNETLSNYETTLLCKDGSTRTVHISSNVLWEDGKFIHTRCFTVDVTEQKKLFQSLKESEANYRRLVKSLPVAVYTTDAEGRITLYNQAAADLWGREPEIGKDLWCGSYKIYRPDGSELPLNTCPMAVALREQRPVFGEEIIIARPNGELCTVAPYPQPIFDHSGKIMGAINMLVDVTDIKRTEQALRDSERKLRQLTSLLKKKVEEKTSDLEHKNEELKKSEERYHKMVEEVEDYAIILLDKNGIIRNWNKGAEKIKGYKEEEIVGKSFKLFYLKEDLEKGLPDQLMQAAIRNGKALHEGWRRRKDGTAFWGSIVLTTLHDDQKNIIGFTKVTRDLTEKKLTEDKLRQYTNELEFQNKELEQFAYAASHDMKEPLRKIHFYNSYISEYSRDQLDEKSKEYLNRSIHAAKRMSELIENLLTYSKTTSNFENFEKVDLNGVVEEIVLLHKDELEQKNVTMDVGPLPVVQGIPFQLRQLLENLISNAIKYKHPDRSVLITIQSKTVEGGQLLYTEAEPDKQYYEISVRDNGIGFASQYAEKIFEIFQRLYSRTDAKGSGIGLAICKKIVQNHQGFIKASGQINEGAEFTIYLPITTT